MRRKSIFIHNFSQLSLMTESTRQELEWPVEAAPSLVMFLSDEPQFFSGDLGDSEAVLAWLRQFARPSTGEQEAGRNTSKTKFSKIYAQNVNFYYFFQIFTPGRRRWRAVVMRRRH